MLVTTLFNLLLLFVITGYSYCFKNFINKKKNQIFNLDILYGLFFLIFLSLFLNFFSPLKYFVYIVILIGLYFFITALKHKKIKINFLIHLFIIFLLSTVVYSNGDNVDSPMYHLQIIKWLYNEKIIFGLPNLEIRFGSNSLWFGILSLLQINLNNFNSIYTFNLIPFSILFYQIFNCEKKISFIFINLSILFLLIFSFLHPFSNGIILNHLHNTEVDTVGMIFFILSFFLFLKYFEDKKKENLHLLIICSVICLVTKLSYIAVLIFPLYALYNYHKNIGEKIINKINLIVIVFICLWFVKNLIISGCILFPVSLSCFNFSWSPGVDEIDTYSKIVKGFARDTRDRLRYTDFEFMIHTYNWLIPWFKDYAMNTAFLKIFFLLLCLSGITLFFSKIFNFLEKISLQQKKNYLIFVGLIFPSLYIWFQAPEIRFGWGSLITFCCFPLSIIIFHFRFFKSWSNNLLKFTSILFLLLLLFDNKSNLSLKNYFKPYVKDTDYSKIIYVKKINEFDLYQSINWKCYDFKEICVNSLKHNYKIEKKFSYLLLTN
jgi:hypothetical protein